MNVAQSIVYVTQPPYSYILYNQFVHLQTILKTVSNFTNYTTTLTTQSIHLPSTLRKSTIDTQRKGKFYLHVSLRKKMSLLLHDFRVIKDELSAFQWNSPLSGCTPAHFRVGRWIASVRLACSNVWTVEGPILSGYQPSAWETVASRDDPVLFSSGPWNKTLDPHQKMSLIRSQEEITPLLLHQHHLQSSLPLQKLFFLAW